jgi:hypothetical protein
MAYKRTKHTPGNGVGVAGSTSSSPPVTHKKRRLTVIPDVLKAKKWFDKEKLEKNHDNSSLVRMRTMTRRMRKYKKGRKESHITGLI